MEKLSQMIGARFEHFAKKVADSRFTDCAVSPQITKLPKKWQSARTTELGACADTLLPKGSTLTMYDYVMFCRKLCAIFPHFLSFSSIFVILLANFGHKKTMAKSSAHRSSLITFVFSRNLLT